MYDLQSTEYCVAILDFEDLPNFLRYCYPPACCHLGKERYVVICDFCWHSESTRHSWEGLD